MTPNLKRCIQLAVWHQAPRRSFWPFRCHAVISKQLQHLEEGLMTSFSFNSEKETGKTGLLAVSEICFQSPKKIDAPTGK